MLLRFTGGTFTDLLNEQDRFILHVYYDGQETNGDETTHLSILPTTHFAFDRTAAKEVMDTFSGVTYVETYHSEAYDLISHFGISHDAIWDEGNGFHRPLIISVKNGWIVRNSFPECYCLDNYIDIIHSIYPELFEPSSVSES